MRTWNALPWHFGAAQYREAVEQAPPRARDLDAARIEASWDGGLALAMDECGLAIAEEAVVAALLDDLRRDAG